MRRLALALILFGAAAPANAKILLWDTIAVVPEASGEHLFRFSVNENAYIEVTTGVTKGNWFPSDGPHVANLFAELTDGNADMMTYHSPFLDVTVPENHPFIAPRTDPPIEGFSSRLTRGAVDLHGWIVEEIMVSFGLRNLGQDPTYRVSVYGEAPEPSAALLFVLGGVGVWHVRARRCRWRQS